MARKRDLAAICRPGFVNLTEPRRPEYWEDRVAC